MAKNMKMNYKRFTIGNQVRINADMILHEDGRIKRYTRSPFRESQIAWIVGAGSLYEGEVIIDYDNGAYFKQSKSIPVWFVKYGLKNKQVAVLDTDVILDTKPYVHPPILKVNQCTWPESSRQFMRDESKNWPRDKKGHWIKMDKTP